MIYLKKLKFFFIVFYIVLLPIITGSFFLKQNFIKSDYSQNFSISLNFKVHNYISSDPLYLKKEELIYEFSRTPLYSIIASYFIITEKEKLIDDCKNINSKECYFSATRYIQLFNLVIFVISIILTFLLARNFLSISFNLILITILSFNTFFLSHISLISNEILSYLFLIKSLIFSIEFIKKKNLQNIILTTISLSGLIL